MLSPEDYKDKLPKWFRELIQLIIILAIGYAATSIFIKLLAAIALQVSKLRT